MIQEFYKNKERNIRFGDSHQQYDITPRKITLKLNRNVNEFREPETFYPKFCELSGIMLAVGSNGGIILWKNSKKLIDFQTFSLKFNFQNNIVLNENFYTFGLSGYSKEVGIYRFSTKRNFEKIWNVKIQKRKIENFLAIYEGYITCLEASTEEKILFFDPENEKAEFEFNLKDKSTISYGFIGEGRIILAARSKISLFKFDIESKTQEILHFLNLKNIYEKSIIEICPFKVFILANNTRNDDKSEILALNYDRVNDRIFLKDCFKTGSELFGIKILGYRGRKLVFYVLSKNKVRGFVIGSNFGKIVSGLNLIERFPSSFSPLTQFEKISSHLIGVGSKGGLMTVGFEYKVVQN